MVLHHIGFVVASIAASAEGFAQSLMGSWDGKVIHDPLQAVHVTFLHSARATDPMIELIEPAQPDSPVSKFLKHGGGLHHLCYEVNDLEAQIESSRQQGGLLVRPPMPAAAFNGRRIAWVYTRQRLLLEYLER